MNDFWFWYFLKILDELLRNVTIFHKNLKFFQKMPISIIQRKIHLSERTNGYVEKDYNPE